MINGLASATSFTNHLNLLAQQYIDITMVYFAVNALHIHSYDRSWHSMDS